MNNKYYRHCAENRKVIANMNQAGKNQDEIARKPSDSAKAPSARNWLATMVNVAIDLPKLNVSPQKGKAGKGLARK